MTKLTTQELKEFGLLGVRSAPKNKGIDHELEKKVTELSVHMAVCKYLKLQYPSVMFLSDFAAGMKLTPGMAARQTMQKSNHSFPDLMILEPRNGYYGLFIELKRDRSALYKKDGSYIKSEHIEAQGACIHYLRLKGYFATFACGFDEAKSVIDRYLQTDNL